MGQTKTEGKPEGWDSQISANEGADEIKVLAENVLIDDNWETSDRSCRIAASLTESA